LAVERVGEIRGTALPVRGDDIDTDRIIPARFLKAISFEGLEAHLFEDDRRELDAARPDSHPVSNPIYAGAALMIVNANFGCGSSREHAPQGIVRAGYKAIIGESFSEIFLGNSAVLGLPCLTADHETIDRLQTLIEKTPEVDIAVDVATGKVTAGPLSFTASIPTPLRDAFVQGKWDPTAMLVDKFDDVRGVAKRLPYVAGF